MKSNCLSKCCFMSLLFLNVAALAAVPLHLPRPDGQPGAPAKPVQVYILAGQSNMVGMGDLTGARPLHPSIFLSADPAVLPGSMPIGNSALAAHGVYVSAEADAPAGAVAHVYRGAYDPEADYANRTPEKTAPVALGTTTATLPAIEGAHTVVVRAAIDVPATGRYTVQAGFEGSSHCVIVLDGEEVYRKSPGGRPDVTTVALETGRRYPLTITYQEGGSAAFWLQQVAIEGRGDLVTLTRKEGMFPYLVDDEGNWTVRRDVFYKEARLRPDSAGSWLSATSNGRSIGPELGFGHVLGTFHDEPVLLIKTAQGNRSLGFDFRPPSSGRTAPDNQYEGLEYRLMVQGVRGVLENLDQILPGYQGQGYEIAGFCWFQGHKDAGASKEEYEKHLVNLINDLRQEFDVPNLPAVVATVGFGGYRPYTQYQPIWEAQMAVGDPAQHPAFAGNVASVDIRDFWREVEESPRSQDYHYHRNPETYLLVGEAMGRAMVRLRGGQAEPIPLSDREARTAARIAAEAAKPVPTDEQKAAALEAVTPIVLHTLLPAFANDARNRPRLLDQLRGERPAQAPTYLDDLVDQAAGFYRSVGIRDYDWRRFGPDPAEIEWTYHSFDLTDPEAGAKGIRELAVTHPTGLENWHQPGFNSQAAGWRSGRAPFGVVHDPLAHEYPEWYLQRGGRPRAAPETAFEGDVLLLRQAFALPELREGHRYRIRVGGSARHNCGEGFAIYLNGELLSETKSGVVAWRREGGRPRGGHVGRDLHAAFNGGEVTLAISNFPMNNRGGGFLPARDPLRVWFEEQKLPPLQAIVEE